MTRYLVTGGAGFIGSNIVAELVQRGEEVRVLDNFSTGKRANLDAVKSRIDLIEGDLRDLDTVQRAAADIDFVLHQGAVPSVPRSIDDPLTSDTSNVIGTLNLLIAARDAEVKRVVYASSSSVYGDAPTLPKHEDMKTAPMSPYAVSKLSAEQYCQVFYQVYGLETVCLRYFNVFGPRQDPASQYSAVIPKFITRMLAGEAPIIHGDGLQSRDFTYVSNNVAANILATTAPNVAGEVFNIACGERYSLLDLVAALNEILDTNIAPEHDTARPGDVKHSLADISKAQAKLNYHTEIDFKAGLHLTVEWYRQ